MGRLSCSLKVFGKLMWVRMFICNQLHLRLDMASPGRYVWTEAGNGPASSNETSSVHITALTWFRCGVLSLRVILAKRAATGWRSAVLTRDVSPVWARALRAIRADPDDMLHAAKVSVWARWFVWLVGVVELAYRPGFWYAHNKSYLLLSVPLVAFNGFLHYRLRSNRTVTWRCLLFLSAMDIALITAAVIIGGEFHLFSYVAYYPALALFAVVFTSLPLSLGWTTLVAVVYAVVSLATGSGLDFDAGQEKALLARVMAMYGIVACVVVVARFERVRRHEAMERELGLHRERIELSQSIHDTTAQTAYMVGLGIQRAMRLAAESNQKLTATLAATLELSKAAMWGLRRPIDQGYIFEGRELAGCFGLIPRRSGKSRRCLPRCCRRASSGRFLRKLAPACFPSPTTPSLTLSCTPEPAGLRSGWTSRLNASGCPCQTMGLACPTTTPSAAAASGA